MTDPIYKMYLGRWTPAWRALSAEDRQALAAEAYGALRAAGGAVVIHCTAEWSNDAWHWFGVERFPSKDAERQYAAALARIGWQKYVSELAVLGSELPPGVLSADMLPPAASP
jgi:hypothetical protein